jgi:ketosteroid isomerase-like protein
MTTQPRAGHASGGSPTSLIDFNGRTDVTDNSTLIRSLYDAFGRGDVKTILDNIDPSIEWISNGDGRTIPWGGKHRGIEGVASFFQALADNLNFEAFEPREFLASGDAVIVLGRTRAHFMKAAGGTIDSEWAHVFTIKNGKLARFQEFYDTAAIEHAIAA